MGSAFVIGQLATRSLDLLVVIYHGPVGKGPFLFPIVSDARLSVAIH